MDEGLDKRKLTLHLRYLRLQIVDLILQAGVLLLAKLFLAFDLESEQIALPGKIQQYSGLGVAQGRRGVQIDDIKKLVRGDSVIVMDIDCVDTAGGLCRYLH